MPMNLDDAAYSDTREADQRYGLRPMSGPLADPWRSDRPGSRSRAECSAGPSDGAVSDG
jgi:hypothetical protein